jgi:putative DNA methylase
MQKPPSRARLIESDTFPFECLSTIAEHESWRKEIYRPIYHVHKWWANRLGTIFRGILLGCLLQEGEDLQTAFYQKHDFADTSVFDPFMGSGTTVGEAHKLGCTALGRDINPVACEAVRVALGPLNRRRLQDAFGGLSETAGDRIRALYRSQDDKGQSCDVLYYFWVKWVLCPRCESRVDLFSSRIFARNAYPDRKPEVQICCPGCGGVFSALNGDKEAHCQLCGLHFNPHTGPASRAIATCPTCSHSFPIIDAVRTAVATPVHRLYAKLLLTPNREKQYLSTGEGDCQAYQECVAVLEQELRKGTVRLPDMSLADGYNTRQAIGYNYRTWRDFFNARQLLALGWLQDEIARLTDVPTRDAFLTLFSGVLEFNNVFASYKGEGTGAVRHMFAHHILKPERTPIEANVWGTPKSSGSFSNLFKSRLLRALDYREAPFEATVHSPGKAYFVAEPFSGQVSSEWPKATPFSPRAIYLSCGSSDSTGLPDASVDLIVTDPPFFDNVHYSQLADFFFAWQTLYPRGFIGRAATTRQEREVQDTSPAEFARKLKAVLLECCRILRDDGLLVFTYHHSRAEGWTSLAQAIYGAGFSVINAHPVKAEMSVATPKSQAKEPIQLDMILVCRKSAQDERNVRDASVALQESSRRSLDKVGRLASIGLNLSRNDRRLVFVSQFLASLGPVACAETAVHALVGQQGVLEGSADRSVEVLAQRASTEFVRRSARSQQYLLWTE